MWVLYWVIERMKIEKKKIKNINLCSVQSQQVQCLLTTKNFMCYYFQFQRKQLLIL